jgi:hypothetical protein
MRPILNKCAAFLVIYQAVFLFSVPLTYAQENTNINNKTPQWTESGGNSLPVATQNTNSVTNTSVKLTENIIDVSENDEPIFPQECKEVNIFNSQKCQELITLKNSYLYQICPTGSVKECNDYLFNKYGQKICGFFNIDASQCKNTLIEKYQQKVECQNTSGEACNQIIKENIGYIAYKQVLFEEIKQNQLQLYNKSLTLAQINQIAPAAATLIPIKNPNVKITLIPSQEKIIIDNGILKQSAPAVAVIENKANIKIPTQLGQAKTDGVVSAHLAIEKIINKGNGYKISAKSNPGVKVYIYIYSDLPVVVTTQTNESGNLEYEISDSLGDGEHEVYVVINDNTGKVTSKSNPFKLFIREAQAVSFDEFLNAGTPDKSVADTFAWSYIIISLVLMMMGIVFFVWFLSRAHKNQKL